LLALELADFVFDARHGFARIGAAALCFADQLLFELEAYIAGLTGRAGTGSWLRRAGNL
jgi:hypothetical protein